MLTTLKLLTTAGLGAAYLAVASMVAYPRVDAEYDAHFLHRSAECWVPRALRAGVTVLPSVIEIGKVGYPEVCRSLRMDWSPLEAWGAWAHPTGAVLHLPRPPGAGLVELTVRTAPLPNPAIRVRFVLNGRTTDDEIPPGTTTTVAFSLPPESEPYDPDMHLFFSTRAIVPTATRTNAAKFSSVGLGLVAIRFLPSQPGNLDGHP